KLTLSRARLQSSSQPLSPSSQFPNSTFASTPLTILGAFFSPPKAGSAPPSNLQNSLFTLHPYSTALSQTSNSSVPTHNHTSRPLSTPSPRNTSLTTSSSRLATLRP